VVIVRINFAQKDNKSKEKKTKAKSSKERKKKEKEEAKNSALLKAAARFRS
jgi:hypothetical protein|tara:strand:+ start:464 stop:616 length:153 start_codon:yes stop_codon:yes gene_type:complete